MRAGAVGSENVATATAGRLVPVRTHGKKYWLPLVGVALIVGFALPRMVFLPTASTTRDTPTTSASSVASSSAGRFDTGGLARYAAPQSGTVETAVPASLMPAVPQLQTVVSVLVLLIAVPAILAVVRHLWAGRRSRMTPYPESCTVTELDLPAGCSVQLVHLGGRRLLVGRDRSGVKCLLELPPLPPTRPSIADVFGAATSSQHGAATDAMTPSPTVEPGPAAAIITLFRQLKAVTEATRR